MLLRLCVFFGLLSFIVCAVELPALEKGEQMVYRTASTKEQLYHPRVPVIGEEEDDDYYLSEVYDLKRDVFELILGRYPEGAFNLENNFDDVQARKIFEARRLLQMNSGLKSARTADYSQANLFWESTIGVDTRTIVENTVQYPFSAIAKITFSCNSNSAARAICTASFISQNVLITAGHCLVMRRGAVSIQCTDYEVSPAFQNGTAPFGTIKASKIIAAPKWNATNQDYLDSDYGLIVLDEPIGARTGWFSLGINCNDTVIPQLKTAGYPDDFGSGFASVPVPIYDGNFMVTTTCNVTIDQCLNDDKDGSFSHVCDTAGGQSGAGMWQYIQGEREENSVRQIRGVHVRGRAGGDTNTAVYLSYSSLQWIQLMLAVN
eukprot:TRINITY_DN4391_c0_g1_i1.p1 TRINITY_DN4391_c0_g1~~TRINITY_DN4391_c0_g1_i1.p1  ORF type:complete len:377 (-),score=59.66 TRINITY_DN4391_c0_g1_i1:1016-2146(-)